MPKKKTKNYMERQKRTDEVGSHESLRKLVVVLVIALPQRIVFRVEVLPLVGLPEGAWAWAPVFPPLPLPPLQLPLPLAWVVPLGAAPSWVFLAFLSWEVGS